MMFRRPPLAAIICALISVAILCRLGIWQLERLAWKENIVGILSAAYEEKRPPYMRAEDIALLSEKDNPYRRVRLSGEYAGQAFMVAPRTDDGQVGYHSYALLKLKTGGAVLVNRGFAPVGQKISAPVGAATVMGMLRPSQPKGLFTPRNDPARDQWYYADPVQMEKKAGVGAVAPLILYAETEEPASGFKPVPRWNPPNNHKNYAIFWFSMAGVLLVVFYLRFIHPQNKYGINLPSDIIRYIDDVFSPADRSAVRALLLSAKIHDESAADARMLRCALISSGGDLARLRAQVAGLAIDYRDVITAGEYERKKGEWVQIRDLAQPFGGESI